jgi:hypothetical protein
MQNNSHGKKRTENTEKSNNNSFYAYFQCPEIQQEGKAHSGCNMDLNRSTYN